MPVLEWVNTSTLSELFSAVNKLSRLFNIIGREGGRERGREGGEGGEGREGEGREGRGRGREGGEVGR